MTAEQWVVITFAGDDYNDPYEPEDVSSVFGPFESREAAMFWAKRNLTTPWVHRSVRAPEENGGRQ